MREEAERLLVDARRVEPGPLHLERRGAGVLEAAAPPVGEVEDEEVPVVREPAHERAVGLHDPPRVPREPVLVEVPAPPDREVMALPERGERDGAVRPDLDRRVRELVVVARGEDGRAALERGRDAPPRGRRDLEDVRLALASANEREDRRAVQVAVRHVEVAGPDREIVRVDAVADGRRLRAARRDAEAVLVEPLDGERPPPGTLGREALEVARVLADEVAAGGPHREDELDRRARAVDRRLHVEEVRVRLGHREAMAHRAQSSRDHPPPAGFLLTFGPNEESGGRPGPSGRGPGR